MDRDYFYFNQYYDELMGDIYPQPPTQWHFNEMAKLVQQWIAPLGISSVLDVGCGEGEAQEFFENLKISYLGIAIGADVQAAKKLDRNVEERDFTFTGFESGKFNLIFSRHSLEHSPFPLLTFMEWHRISSRYLCLVVPNPKHFTDVGRNHYSVASQRQTNWWLRRAGWRLSKFRGTDKEFWFLCEKWERKSYEGWVKPPVSQALYEFERDKLEINVGDVTMPKRIEFMKRL